MLLVQTSPPAVPSRPALHWLGLVVVLIAAAVAAWIWFAGAEERAIHRLPVEERRVLFEREMATFTTLCAGSPADEALADRCRERAEFLAKFPECDSSCRDKVREHEQEPTR